MNLVVLSHCGPFDRYLIGRVHRHWPIQHIIRPVWTADPTLESRRARLCKAPIGSLLEAVTRRWDDRNQRRLDDSLARLLEVDMLTDALPAPHTDIPHHDINRPATAELLQSFLPDVLLVASAPLLKPAIFTVPRVATLNVHRGIAPEYRGENTVFWPLYFRDFAHIGTTVHCIDRGVDSGPLLAHGYPALDDDDTEITLTAKLARVAAELLVDVLAAADNGHLTGFKHPEPGRCFKQCERRPVYDLDYFLRRNLLGERLPPQPERTVYYLQRQLTAIH